MKHIEIMNLNLEEAGLEDCTLYPQTCGCCGTYVCTTLRKPPGVLDEL